MKRLKKMRLINWHYFEDETLEFGNQTLITGKNGAGKSTIIDAMQVIFVADQRHIRFNPAAHDEARRSMINYLRGKIGNDQRTFIRDGDFTTYIICEFRDDDKKESFSIGVVIDVYRDQTFEEEYFILADQKMDDLDLIKSSGHLRNREEFKKVYDQGGRARSIFERQKSNYQKALLSRLGQLHERFFSIFTKALSFKPIDNIRHFVYDYILDHKELQLDLMKENFNIHERYQRELIELEQRRDKLREICDCFQQYEKHRETAQEQDYVIRRLTYVQKCEIYDQTEQKLNVLKQDVQQLEERSQLASQKEKEARTESEKAYQRWQQHKAQIKKQQLENEISTLKEELKQLGQKLSIIIKQLQSENRLVNDLLVWTGNEQWQWEEGDRKRLEESGQLLAYIIRALDKGQKPSMEKEQFSLHPVDSRAVDNKLSSMAEEIVEVGSFLATIYERLLIAVSRIEKEQEQLSNEIEELHEVINNLEQKKRTYSPSVQKLKQLLEERLSERSSVYIFCEEMEIKDEKWRNVIEGYLNTQRFDLLVQPEVFEEALKIYEQNKWTYKIEGVGLVDTQKEKHYLGSSQEGALADMLQVENPIVQAHMEHLLGRVMRAENEQELRRHRVAVTQSCMVYQRLVARQMKKERYAIPFIGSKAIMRQLEIKRQELEERKEQLVRLNVVHNVFFSWKERLQEKKSRYDSLSEGLTIPEQLDIRMEKKQEVEEELATLDLSEAEKYETEYHHWRETEEEWNNEHKELIGKIESKKGDQKYTTTELYLQEKQRDEAHDYWQEWISLYGPEAEQRAVQRWKVAEQQDIPTAQKIRNWDKNMEGNQTRAKEEFETLIQIRADYNANYHLSVASNDEDNKAYSDLLHDIEHLNIPDYRQKVDQALRDSEEQFKSHFVYKLKEAIELARREFNELNFALRNFPFSDDHYRFDVKASEKYKRFYDAIMDPMLIEKGSLFDIEDDERSHVLHELFEKLVQGEEVEEFTDYRRYLDFDIEVTTNEPSRYFFSKVLKEKSGGETQTPFYIAILASFHHLYQSHKAMKLVVFDEAFNKMDEQRIQTSLRLIKNMNLQLVAAVPDEKMQHMVPEVTTTLIVSNQNYRCFVDLLDYEEEDEAYE